MHMPILEPDAQKIADATSTPPFLYQLGTDGARKVLDDLQAAPVHQPALEAARVRSRPWVPSRRRNRMVPCTRPSGSS